MIILTVHTHSDQPQKMVIYCARARRTAEPVRLLRYCQVHAQI